MVNAYTQFHWQGTGVKANYDAIRSSISLVKSKFSGKRIGYPSIGAGLAGGDWTLISKVLDEELKGEDHVFVQFAT